MFLFHLRSVLIFPVWVFLHSYTVYYIYSMCRGRACVFVCCSKVAVNRFRFFVYGRNEFKRLFSFLI